MTEFKLDKSRLKDSRGRALTQSLFLEMGYNTEFAVYSLGEEDKMYNGVLYPSLKQRYMACEDPTGYLFAKKWLINWKHFERLRANKMLTPYFEEWEEELEVALRSCAIMNIIDESAGDGSFQAKKWIADKGWDKNKVGRPSKEDEKRNQRIKERINSDFSDDLKRMTIIK